MKLRPVLIFLTFILLCGISSAATYVYDGDTISEGSYYWQGESVSSGETHHYEFIGSAANAEYAITFTNVQNIKIYEVFIYDYFGELVVDEFLDYTEDAGYCPVIYFTLESCNYADIYVVVFPTADPPTTYRYDFEISLVGSIEPEPTPTPPEPEPTPTPTPDPNPLGFDCDAIPDNEWWGWLHDTCEAFASFEGGIVSVLQDFMDFIQDTWRKVAEFFSWLVSLPGQFLEWVSEGFAKLIEYIQEAISDAATKIVEGLRWIAESIGSIVGGFISAIGSFFGGIWKAIEDGFEWLTEQFSDFFDWFEDLDLDKHLPLIIAIVLLAVGLILFRPALWIGIIVLGLYGLSLIASGGDIITRLFGDVKNLAMIVLAIAGLVILMRR